MARYKVIDTGPRFIAVDLQRQLVPGNRFTLRGRRKVDTQWKRYCRVHNIEKLAHHGYGQLRKARGKPCAAPSNGACKTQSWWDGSSGNFNA